MAEQQNILVVDDDPAIRRIICRVLGAEGFSTEEAPGGIEAVHMAEQREYSLIILDLIMEDMDGFQVISYLRAHGILTPVFVLSGRQAETDKVLALGIGADDYITKPFSTMVLCAKVKACLRRISDCPRRPHRPHRRRVPVRLRRDEALQKRGGDPPVQQGGSPHEIFYVQHKSDSHQRADLQQCLE